MITACTAETRQRLFVGQLTPGSGRCEASDEAMLTLRGDKAQFSPNGGVLLLDGKADAAGQVAASLTLRGASGIPYALRLDAHREADRITGTYTTPDCRAAISLHAVRE